MRVTAAFARWMHLGVVAVLVVTTMLQRPGRTTWDTKFDLTEDPGQFLTRALHLWNPDQNFGELQNQAYGYLFPQGAWFWLTDVAGISAALSQRVWSTMLLLAAYEGLRRIHRVLWPGRPELSVLAGLAYATAPRLLGLSGLLSAEVLPTAVLPWAVLPLLAARAGLLGPRAGGLLAGCAVLFFGGVNAVENFATYPLLFFVVLVGIRTAPGRRLARWWAFGTALATLWWFLPLLVLGRYSPPFLNYIETAAATTRPLGWSNVVRGANHWLSFLTTGGRPLWPGSYELAVDPALVVITTLVAAVSLAGLFAADLPLRAPLVLSALLGMVLLVVGHSGFGSSLIDPWVRELLDGPLSPFRNVHKVDPLIRLPLALGFAHAIGHLGAGLHRLDRRPQVSRWLGPGLTARVRGGAAAVAAMLALGLLTVSAAPLFTGEHRLPGWQRIPESWSQAARYLEANQEDGTALVLPGSGFAQQYWGWTFDQPLQGISSAAWASRTQVPLVPGATVRFLDSIEERIGDGSGSVSLADVLAGAGVTHVVVRRDLDLLAADPPRPARVDAAIAVTPGLELVASFGRSGFGDQPAIDIYRVTLPVPRVAAPVRSSLVRTAGGAEDLLTARELGLIAPGQSSLFDAGDPDVVGDGFRRQERQFGQVRDALSQVLTAEEPYRIPRAAHDYDGLAGQRRVVAEYTGARLVTASSSGGYADVFGPVRADLGPSSAVDGNLDTAWQSAPFQRPTDQWLQIDLGETVELGTVTVQTQTDRAAARQVLALRLEAGDRVLASAVDPDTGLAGFDLTGTSAELVRVEVAEVTGSETSGVVGIREVTVQGRSITRRLTLPETPTSRDTAWTFRAEPGRKPCVVTGIGPVCDLDDARSGTEDTALRRSFTTGERGRWEGRGVVVARDTPQAAALLQPLLEGAVVTADSVLGDDPAVSGRFAFDGDPNTAWLAEPGVRSATVRMDWAKPRTVRRIRIVGASGSAEGPIEVTVTGRRGQQQVVDLREGSFGVFPPIRTQSLLLDFRGRPIPEGAATASTRDRAGLGVAEILIDGLEPEVRPVSPGAPTGAVCGLGPALVIDGVTHDTEVTGTLGDLVAGRGLQWRVCDGPVRLERGEHRLDVAASAQFTLRELTLAPLSPTRRTDTEPDRARRTEIVSSDIVSDVVRVGPGAEAVLRLPRNLNAGWEATLEGRQLQATPIDGWQQGFVLPAGPGGLVRVEFAPDRPYRFALLVGLFAALGLTGMAVSAVLTPKLPMPRTRAMRGRRVAFDGSGASGANAVGSGDPSGGRIRAWVVAMLAAAAWTVAGPFVAAGIVVAAAGVRLRPGPGRRAAAVRTGVLLIALSGIAAWVDVEVSPGRSAPLADLLAAVGMGMLVMSAVGRVETPGPRASVGAR